MATQRIGSSIIAVVDYDEKRRHLDVTFHTGRVYRYFSVPPAVYDQLVAADSKGKFFNQQIRPRYRATYLGRTGGRPSG